MIGQNFLNININIRHSNIFFHSDAPNNTPNTLDFSYGHSYFVFLIQPKHLGFVRFKPASGRRQPYYIHTITLTAFKILKIGGASILERNSFPSKRPLCTKIQQSAVFLPVHQSVTVNLCSLDNVEHYKLSQPTNH